MKHVFVGSALMAIAALCPLCAIDVEELARYAEKIMAEKNVPGAAIVIVEGDKVVLARGLGVRRHDAPDKVDGDTIFQLASATKVFTSAALAVQVDANKLSWDEEIINHLPAFALKDAYPSRYATCRDLLAHRTGLPAFRGDLLGKLGLSQAEILRRIRHIEPASSFREEAHYSNVGFFAAGELLAAVAGKSFEEAVLATLLAPMGMQRTGFSNILKGDNVAVTHAVIDGKVQAIPRDDQQGFSAAGGLASTANDMGRWLVMQLNGGKFSGKQVLTADAVKAMHAPSMVSKVEFTDLPPIDDNSSFSFGMGWDNYNYNGKFVVEKGGALDGVRSVITLVPESKAGIAILANLNLTVMPELVRARFLEMVAGSNGTDIAQQINEREGKIAALLKVPERPKDALPPAHPLKMYEGTFDSPLYGAVRVAADGSRLLFHVGSAGWQGTLSPWGNDTFLLRWPLIDSGHELATFTFGPEGKAMQIHTETLGTFKIRDEDATPSHA